MSSWTWLTKFVIIGDPSVGKSSLLVRLTDDRFLTNPETTIGVEFGSHIVEIEETGERIKCQCWDTAGSETFRSVSDSNGATRGDRLLKFSLCRLPGPIIGVRQVLFSSIASQIGPLFYTLVIG